MGAVCFMKYSFFKSSKATQTAAITNPENIQILSLYPIAFVFLIGYHQVSKVGIANVMPMCTLLSNAKGIFQFFDK